MDFTSLLHIWFWQSSEAEPGPRRARMSLKQMGGAIASIQERFWGQSQTSIVAGHLD